MYGLGSSVRNIHLESNTNARVGDQNVHGPGPSVRNYYKRSNLRSIAMPLGSNEVNVNLGRSSLTVASRDVNFMGQFECQNLHGWQSPQNDFDVDCGGVNSYPKNLSAIPRSGEELVSFF